MCVLVGAEEMCAARGGRGRVGSAARGMRIESTEQEERKKGKGYKN